MTQPISMPWSSPLFGQLPHRWQGVRMAVLPFTPRPGAVARILPPGMEPADGPGLLTFLSYPPSGFQHPFEEAVVMVPVRVDETLGNYVPYIYVTTDEALATERVQGGKPIVRHQAIQLLLADMSIRVEAARGLVWRSAASAAAGRPSLKLASMAKTFASDAAVANATDAIQVLGGNGYMREYGVEKLLRDAKLTQIYEGTNQINRFEIMEAVMEEIGA